MQSKFLLTMFFRSACNDDGENGEEHDLLRCSLVGRPHELWRLQAIHFKSESRSKLDFCKRGLLSAVLHALRRGNLD